MSSAESFGPRLRRERERRGIALERVAGITKVSASLFEAMERNDVSRWPGGIFRRSFMRAYAEALGLDAEQTVAEFLRVFPCESDRLCSSPPIVAAPPPEAAAPGAGLSSAVPFRLELADASIAAGRVAVRLHAPALRRVVGDLAFALVFGVAGGLLAGAVGFWTATAVAALVHHAFGTLGLHARTARRPRTSTRVIARVRAVVTMGRVRLAERRARAPRTASVARSSAPAAFADESDPAPALTLAGEGDAAAVVRSTDERDLTGAVTAVADAHTDASRSRAPRSAPPAPRARANGRRGGRRPGHSRSAGARP